MILSLNSGWNPIFSGFRESGSWGLRGSPCEAPFGPLNRFRRTRFDSGPRFLDFSLFQNVLRCTPRFRGNEAAPPPRNSPRSPPRIPSRPLPRSLSPSRASGGGDRVFSPRSDAHRLFLPQFGVRPPPPRAVPGLPPNRHILSPGPQPRMTSCRTIYGVMQFMRVVTSCRSWTVRSFLRTSFYMNSPL